MIGSLGILPAELIGIAATGNVAPNIGWQVRLGDTRDVSLFTHVTAAQAFAIHEAWGLLADELAARESEVAA